MRGEGVVEGLGIPEEALVGKRVPKKLLMERLGQNRRLLEVLEELVWVAALKPNTVGVGAYRDGVHEYLEIVVLVAKLKVKSAGKLPELIHRAIPYPVFLIVESDAAVGISLAHKRWSEAEHGETVVEGYWEVGLAGGALEEAFVASLAIGGVGAREMFGLYQGWIDRLNGYRAAGLCGTYTVPVDGEKVHRALERHSQVERELAGLRARARGETQMARRVELNLMVRKLDLERLSLVAGMDLGKEGRG